MITNNFKSGRTIAILLGLDPWVNTEKLDECWYIKNPISGSELCTDENLSILKLRFYFIVVCSGHAKRLTRLAYHCWTQL